MYIYSIATLSSLASIVPVYLHIEKHIYVYTYAYIYIYIYIHIYTHTYIYMTRIRICTHIYISILILVFMFDVHICKRIHTRQHVNGKHCQEKIICIYTYMQVNYW
jgi:hypothetical protein